MGSLIDMMSFRPDMAAYELVVDADAWASLRRTGLQGEDFFTWGLTHPTGYSGSR